MGALRSGTLVPASIVLAEGPELAMVNLMTFRSLVTAYRYV